jgi:hypothetical protein
MNSANWRTTLTATLAALTSTLTVVAALPAQLGELSTIIPEHWKTKVISAGLVATLILRVLNGLVAKDKTVAGNGTAYDPYKVADGHGGNRTLPPLVILAALLPALAFSSCATQTGDRARDARGRATNAALLEAGRVLGKVAVATLYNVAQQEMTGGHADFASAASAGLWSNAGKLLSSAAVERVITAYAADRLPETATAAADAFTVSAAPPAQKTAAIAAVISTAAGSPPR